jgi:hypothetical protein
MGKDENKINSQTWRGRKKLNNQLKFLSRKYNTFHNHTKEIFEFNGLAVPPQLKSSSGTIQSGGFCPADDNAVRNN